MHSSVVPPRRTVAFEAADGRASSKAADPRTGSALLAPRPCGDNDTVIVTEGRLSGGIRGNTHSACFPGDPGTIPRGVPLIGCEEGHFYA